MISCAYVQTHTHETKLTSRAWQTSRGLSPWGGVCKCWLCPNLMALGHTFPHRCTPTAVEQTDVERQTTASPAETETTRISRHAAFICGGISANEMHYVTTYIHRGVDIVVTFVPSARASTFPSRLLMVTVATFRQERGSSIRQTWIINASANFLNFSACTFPLPNGNMGRIQNIRKFI